MWFEAHDTMGKHPKTLRLAQLLNIKRREAVGLLFDLFSWGLTAAKKDGALDGLTDVDIGMALDCTTKPQSKKLVKALVDAGYMEYQDGTYYIHEWYDYCGRLNDQREMNRKRKQRERDKAKKVTPMSRGRHADKSVTSQECHDPTVPNLTIPNQTLSDERVIGRAPALREIEQFAAESGLPQNAAAPFADYYGARGWQVGGSPVADWQALFRSWCRRETGYGDKGVTSAVPQPGGAPRVPSNARRNVEWMRQLLEEDEAHE